MLPNPLVNVIQAFKVSHILTNNIQLKGENNSNYSTCIANVARIVKVTKYSIVFGNCAGQVAISVDKVAIK